MNEQEEKYLYLSFQRFHAAMQTMTSQQKAELDVFADEGIVRIIGPDDILLYQMQLEEAFTDLFLQLYGVSVDPHRLR